MEIYIQREYIIREGPTLFTRSYYREESAAMTHKLDAKFPNPIKEHY